MTYQDWSAAIAAKGWEPGFVVGEDGATTYLVTSKLGAVYAAKVPMGMALKLHQAARVDLLLSVKRSLFA